MKAEGPPLTIAEATVQWALALLLLVVTLCLARCSFTAIRYEDPDCSKCALQCPGESVDRR